MIKFHEMNRISGVEDIFFPFLNEKNNQHTTINDLRAVWRKASEIEEFSVCAEKLSLQNIMVARVSGFNNESGFCYIPDLYEDITFGKTLIAIDEKIIPGHMSLLDLFLHEIAHTKTSRGEGHDWEFVVALNMIRARCGLAYTQDEYDCCQVYNDDSEYSSDEILKMAESVATQLEQIYSFEIGIQIVRSLGFVPSYSFVLPSSTPKINNALI